MLVLLGRIFKQGGGARFETNKRRRAGHARVTRRFSVTQLLARPGCLVIRPSYLVALFDTYVHKIMAARYRDKLGVKSTGVSCALRRQGRPHAGVTLVLGCLEV